MLIFWNTARQPGSADSLQDHSRAWVRIFDPPIGAKADYFLPIASVHFPIDCDTTTL